MPICPACRYDYEPNVSVCPECGEKLQPKPIPSREPEPRDDRLVSVFRAASELKLLEVKSALEEEGIRSFLRSFAVPAYDDLFVDPSGAWGELLVLERDASRAAPIVEVITTGHIAELEGQGGASPKPPADAL